MVTISQNAIATVKQLNDQLFGAECELEAQQRAVSKYRYYLAADATQETVMDLRGAMKNLQGCQQRVDHLRQRLTDTLENIWSL